MNTFGLSISSQSVENIFWEQQNFARQKKFGEPLPSKPPPRGYGPGFNKLPDIFTVMNCSVLGDC